MGNIERIGDFAQIIAYGHTVFSLYLAAGSHRHDNGEQKEYTCRIIDTVLPSIGFASDTLLNFKLPAYFCRFVSIPRRTTGNARSPL